MRGPAYGRKGRLMWGTSSPPASRPDAIACLTLPARGLDVSLLDASCHAVWRSCAPADVCPAAPAAFAPAPAAHPSCLSLGPALCPMLVCALAALRLHAAAAAQPGSLLSCWAALGVLLLSRSLSSPFPPLPFVPPRCRHLLHLHMRCNAPLPASNHCRSHPCNTLFTQHAPRPLRRP